MVLRTVEYNSLATAKLLVQKKVTEYLRHTWQYSPSRRYNDLLWTLLDAFHFNILWEYFDREESVCFGIHGCEEAGESGNCQ